MGFRNRINIAVLGSGAGTNARTICSASRRQDSSYNVCLLLTTSQKSGINEVAREFGIECVVLAPGSEARTLERELLLVLSAWGIDVLVLAGYMRLLPVSVINALGGRVLNIHPALLPQFGGPGMYGMRVHNAVLAAKTSESGATVHLVTEHYDEGGILGQKTVGVLPSDTPEILQQRVKVAEHELYPTVIQSYCSTLLSFADVETKLGDS